MRNDFEKAIHFRHACKIFDESKNISDEDLSFILEAGRMSPSSFGMEQWHFIVITNQAIKEQIKKVSWDQPQITTASKLLIIAHQKQVRSEDEYIQGQFQKFGYPDMLKNLYKNWIDHRSDEELCAWSAKQSYIAAGNMMSAAASIGIDSCPIEGFDKDSVEKILNLDTSKLAVAMLLPFGYRIKPQQPRLRSTIKEITTFIE